MTDKRVLLVSEDGTAEVNGVRVRVVPVEPTKAMMQAAQASEIEGYHGDYLVADDCYAAMLSAAALDFSGLPRVPKRRREIRLDRGCDDFGWNAALDAMGVK